MMKTSKLPAECTHMFLSTQRLLWRLHTPLYKRPGSIHFSSNKQPLPLSKAEIWAQTTTTTTQFHLHLTSHIRDTCTGTNPHGRAGLRFLLPGWQRPLPGRQLARRKCGFLQAAVSDRQREALESGAGPGWRQRRPGPGQPKRSSFRRLC